MKILHVLYESKGDHFGPPPPRSRAYEIYRHLRERHDVTLLCKKYPGARDGEAEGVRHIFVGAESKSLTVTLLSFAYKAASFIRERGLEYDVIIEEFSPAVPVFLHAFAKRPVVLQVQGYTGPLYFRKYNPLYAAVLLSLEHLRPLFYENFIFITPRTAKRLLLENKRYQEVIPNGVSPDLIAAQQSEGEYVLYLGRIDVYGKGLDLLLSSYADFSRWFPGLRLLIAGDGRDMKKFREMISKMPATVKENIGFAGWVSGGRKTEVLQKAKFAVFPSRHEVQPIAVLEAMAAGKAVIVSSIREFGFVTRTGSGLAFESGDASSLATTMKRLAADGGLDEMGRRGREFVKDRTWDKVAMRFEEFLLKALNRGK